jgi:hypothetical protein
MVAILVAVAVLIRILQMVAVAVLIVVAVLILRPQVVAVLIVGAVLILRPQLVARAQLIALCAAHAHASTRASASRATALRLHNGCGRTEQQRPGKSANQHVFHEKLLSNPAFQGATHTPSAFRLKSAN